MVAISYMWPLSDWIVAYMTEELNFKFYLFLMNLLIPLKPDICFSYWKTFKYILKQFGM